MPEVFEAIAQLNRFVLPKEAHKSKRAFKEGLRDTIRRLKRMGYDRETHFKERVYVGKSGITREPRGTEPEPFHLHNFSKGPEKPLVHTYDSGTWYVNNPVIVSQESHRLDTGFAEKHLSLSMSSQVLTDHPLISRVFLYQTPRRAPELTIEFRIPFEMETRKMLQALTNAGYEMRDAKDAGNIPLIAISEKGKKRAIAHLRIWHIGQLHNALKDIKDRESNKAQFSIHASIKNAKGAESPVGRLLSVIIPHVKPISG